MVSARCKSSGEVLLNLLVDHIFALVDREPQTRANARAAVKPTLLEQGLEMFQRSVVILPVHDKTCLMP